MIAFAWGAFWIGFIVGPVVITIITLTWLTFTDEEMKKSRAVSRRMNQDAREARRSLYEDRRREVREDLDRRFP